MPRTANGKHLDKEFRKFFDKVREAQVVEGEVQMKRIAVFALLVVLSGSSEPAAARGVSLTDDSRQSEKEEQKKQKALEKYRRAQQKAQAKAQQKEDKKQRKAAAKYEKEQRKLLKNANRPEKPTS